VIASGLLPNLAFHKASGKLRRLQIVRLQSFAENRYLQAIAAGLLLAASFPNFGLAGAAWLAPGLMLFAATGASGRTAFRVGYVAGLAHYLVSLYWLLFIPVPYGALAGWLALSAYLAMYPAVWVWLCWRMFPKSRPDISALAIAKSSLPQRALWAIGCAVVWVALEMIMARMLAGFPWNLLGASQYQKLPLIQIASITGIYGLSFLIVWFSVALACAFLALLARPTARAAWLGDLILPLLAVIGVVTYGVRAQRPEPSLRTIKVALVQPSIPQTLIWDPKEDANRFQQLIQLSERALETKPDLLIWPEAAVPSMLRYEPENFEAVAKLAKEHHVWIIVGADDLEPRPGATNLQDVDYYNSSFLISPDGELVVGYRKQKLVIFGEYIPLIRWLPFLKYLSPVGVGFSAGDRPVSFQMPELKAKTSVLICFEDTFPHLARKYVQPDTDFLLNLTNNGWFGESAAQWQHAASAIFRAVENRLPLVRCANNGLTCWVDAFGGMHEVYFPDSEDVYRAGFKTARIPLLQEGEFRTPTIYNRYGDWFGWGCVGLTVGWAGLCLKKRKARGFRW
jgi:apolipoprotein N-acyltransferase